MNNQEHELRYLDRDLIAILTDLSGDLERCPVISDFDKRDDLPDISTFERRFGSWHDALKEAGLSPRYSQGQDKLLSEVVQWMVEHCGRLPSKADCKRKNGLPAAQTLRNNFGSLAVALSTAEEVYVNDYTTQP